MATKLPNPIKYVDQNPVEAMRDVVSHVENSFKSDVIEAGVTTAWEQLLGLEPKAANKAPESGDLTEGVELNLSREQGLRSEAAYDYKGEVLQFETRAQSREDRELNFRVENVRNQIKIEISKGQTSRKEVNDISVEQKPNVIGVYHEGFLEGILRTARLEASRASSWANEIHGKSRKKDGIYWANARKYGTQYTLGGERVVATQVG